MIKQLNLKYSDISVICLLSIIAFVGVWLGFHYISPAIFNVNTFDYWFECDSPHVYNQLFDRWGPGHCRTNRHPLFSLLTFFPTYAIKQAFSLSPITAVSIVMASVTSLWISILFIFFRTIRLKLIDATVFCILAAMSASTIFWFPVPETYSFGALTIMMAVTVVSLSERFGPPPLWLSLLISVLTLGITITNWMAGLLMLFAILSWKKALKLAVLSLFVVIIAAFIQKLIFPNAQLSLEIFGSTTNQYILNPFALGLAAKAKVFFFHSIIMPEINEAYNSYMSIQGALLGSNFLTTISAIIWVCLLAMAVWGINKWKNTKAIIVLVLVIGGQLLLSFIFGLETFLYSLHFGPLLVAFSSMSTLTQARKVVLPMATVLAVLIGVNNFEKFIHASNKINQKYQFERMFTKRVGELTEQESRIILVVGRGGTGGATPGQTPPETWPVKIIPHLIFSGMDAERSGWIVCYGDLTIKVIEALRQRGAKYLVISNIDKFDTVLTLNRNLAKEYKKIEQIYTHIEVISKWAIYRLENPSIESRNDKSSKFNLKLPGVT